MSKKKSSLFGCCASQNQPPRRSMEKEVIVTRKKIVLLGVAGAGKSVIFRQLLGLFGSGLPDAQERRKNFYPIVIYNILSSMKQLVVHAEKDGSWLKSDEIKDAVASLQAQQAGGAISESLAAAISLLWKQVEVQARWEMRSKYHILESASYFFDHVQAICAPDYVPTDVDVFNCYTRTTGIVDSEISFEGGPHMLFDLGGQRNERRKWALTLDNCAETAAILFVIPISAYDEHIREDNQTNCLIESLKLFEEIANEAKTSQIKVFFNKKDLFSQKLKKVPFNVCFPSYKGKGTYEDACEFLVEEIKSKVRSEDIKLRIHFTCALDKNSIGSAMERDQVANGVHGSHY